MLIVIAYIQVSTTKQSHNGSSLDRQRLAIQEFAQCRNLKIHKFFWDDESARNEEDGSERPEFLKATELSLKKEWPIIVLDESRFTRTEETYDRFVKAGGKLYTVKGFGADEAEMRARIKHAEHDGKVRSRATRKGQERYRAEGGVFGSPELGKAREASVEARKKLAKARAREFSRQYERAKKAGFGEPKDAARFFNENGYLTAQGRTWTAANVRRMI